LIFRAALHNPDFATIATTKHVELPNQPGQPPMQVSTDNEVVRDYPGILGAKNGFTDDAQHTFVAAAERNGHRIVTVLMHGDAQLNNQATRLLDYGFDLGNAPPIGQLVPEQTMSAVAPPPVPKNVPANQAKPNPRSEMFGTVGGPLTVLATVGVAALGFLGYRRRRAKLAAAARRDKAKLSNDRS
jgi:D-alanyl-D-alanine carboxypeptidase (penicillin-binding protein 5/6)